MTVVAIEGPAGSGKTHRLMDELGDALDRRPLADHERVIALTFMHGSRRRLDARLRSIELLAGRFEAITLDSFAWHLTQRWQRLALHLGHKSPAEEAYEQTCELAAALLDREAVRTWVSLSYPFVLVDEAQDLSAERSAIIAALAQSCTVLLAFDEFQCLNPALVPIAIEGWLHNYCEPIRLEGCRRTDVSELIETAQAVREGHAVNLKGNKFKVICTPGKPNFAATCLSNAIAWRRRGNVVVLTPSRRGGFADGIINLVRTKSLGKHGNGPYPIEWESSDEEDGAALWEKLAIGDGFTVEDVLGAMAPHRNEPAIRTMREWVIRQRSLSGLQELTTERLRRQLGRALSVRRRYSNRRQQEFAAMTIHQAKNREFDHVIVLWPFTVPKNDEQRRRLFYNAITRAHQSCTVLVQNDALLKASPFVPR
ncbi:MAG: ATP-binding domain-containing protein [Nitrospirales bacterium]|nr:ATP-binding domain-containing protein [Nitrospirales bacterium]